MGKASKWENVSQCEKMYQCGKVSQHIKVCQHKKNSPHEKVSQYEKVSDHIIVFALMNFVLYRKSRHIDLRHHDVWLYSILIQNLFLQIH